MRAVLDPLFSIYNNKKLLLFSVFLISIFASLIFLLLFKNIGPFQHGIPGTDYSEYYKPVAENILEEKGVVFEGKLATGSPPGYPIILSIIFSLSSFLRIEELQLIVIFNVIITALACCLIFLIGEILFSKRIGLLASFLWLSYPFNLWFVKNPNTEVPFILLLYLGIYLYIISIKKKSRKHILVAGIILGSASLIRPTSFLLTGLLFFLIIFLPKDILKNGKYLLAVLLLAGNILIILPWEGYVFFQTRNLIPVSTVGPGSFKAGFTFALRVGINGDRIAVPEDVRALMVRTNAESLNNGKDILYFCSKELFTRPIPFFKLLAIKALRAWYATSQKWYENLTLAVQIPYLLAAFFGLILGIKIYRKKIESIVLLLAVIVYFWAITTVFAHSILRYMIPAMGLVIIFSAVAIERFLIFLKKKALTYGRQ